MAETRTGILNAISDWLKLVGLVVLVAEGVILVAMKITPESNPLARWYPLLMLFFLIVVVAGVFFDRYTQTKFSTQLTLQLEDRKISVETAKITKPGEELKKYDVDTMFVDTQNGFMFPRPKLPGWSKPEQLSVGELLVKKGLKQNLDTWEEEKEAAALIPLGRMFVEAETVMFEYGSPLEAEFTDQTSTRGVDAMLEDFIEFGKKEGKEIDEEKLIEMRRTLVWGDLTVKHLQIQNSFSVSILDKNFAKDSPVVPSLGNVFLAQQRMSGGSVERLAANDDSILWGASVTLTNVLVGGQTRELTMYTLNNMVEGPDRLYVLTISFCPQTESQITVWDELQQMLKSFRILSS